MTADQTDVDRLLAGAAEHLSSTDADADPPEALRELADEANDLVSGAEPPDLLAAVGAGADADDPSTVPEAIMQSPGEAVVDLRALLALSRLSESWGEPEADGHLSTLRELLDTADSDRTAEASDSPDASDATDAEESPDGEAGRGGDGATASGAGETTADQGVVDSLGEDVESALNESLSDFLGEDRSVGEAVSEAVSDERGETAAEADGDGESDPKQPADERRGRIGGSGGPYSTVPSSDRVDMGSATRFSTLRAELRRRNDDRD